MKNHLAAAAAAFLLLPTAPAAASVGTLDGFLVQPGSTQNEVASWACVAPQVCETIAQTWPNSPGTEVTTAGNASAWLANHPDAEMLIGHSYGAQTLEYMLRNNQIPDNIVVVLLGNPERKWGGNLPLTGGDNGCNCGSGTPETTTVVVFDVTRQYDMASDYPNVPSSPYYGLAQLNALMGLFMVHPFYDNINPHNPAYPRIREGNITYVFVPTTQLPILFGGTNEQLQANIETAYARPAYTVTAQEVPPSTLTQTTVAADAPSGTPRRTRPAKPQLSSATGTTATLSAVDTQGTRTRPAGSGELHGKRVSAVPQHDKVRDVTPKPKVSDGGVRTAAVRESHGAGRVSGDVAADGHGKQRPRRGESRGGAGLPG